MECVLKVSSGYLRGTVEETILNSKKYYSFRGIPYAKPPIGPNRFKDPVPYDSWQGVKDATKNGNISPQSQGPESTFVGNEDCLFLNVYTPQIPDLSNPGLLPLPVMVYLHGGRYITGNGTDELYGPDYLIEHDVIMVAINYRLGVLGFLSLGNSDVPGNAGLKDQNLALKWVQDNIKYFGGDSNNVTLQGASSGAAMVHLHAMSQLSHGLFHKVILQSGTALNVWSFCDDPIQRAFKLGELLGCKTNDCDELINFFRDQPPEVLIGYQTKIVTPEENTAAVFPFGPCKEVPGTGVNFLTESPEILMRSNKYADIPYIIGLNSSEQIFQLKVRPTLLSNLDKLNNDPLTVVPYDLRGNIDDVAKKVRRFFFNDEPISLDNINSYFDAKTDLTFTLGVKKTIEYLSIRKTTPIYVYLFSFEGQLSYFKNSIKKIVENLPKGACHGDEVFYLFHNNLIHGKNYSFNKDSPELNFINKFTTLWTNFAKTSDPNDVTFAVKWKCYKAGNPSHLIIDETLKLVETDIFPERTKFWTDVYAQM